MYNRAGQQGKSTDSCPEIENYTETIQQTNSNVHSNICHSHKL